MNKLLMGAVSAIALMAAGSAFAAGGSSATIDQVGSTEQATIDQTNATNGTATVTQGTGGASSTDAYNVTSLTQGGTGNTATVTQTQGAYGLANPSNTSTSDQEGLNGNVTVVQVGNNTSTVVQTSSANDEDAIVGQSNNFNISSIQQSGAQEMGVVNQEYGNGNQASIVQSGTGSGNFTVYATGAGPSGPGYLQYGENVPGVPQVSVLPGAAQGFTTYGPVGAIVDQVGNNNIGAINQAGFENWADVSQENDLGTGGNVDGITQGPGQVQSEAETYQFGQFNTIILSQEGAGSSSSLAFQDGNSNQAYVAQVGSENSTVDQGYTTGDSEPLLVTEAVDNNDYASVNQYGGNDTSLIDQQGNSDSAYVSQGQAGATASVRQAGVSNLAIIRQ